MSDAPRYEAEIAGDRCTLRATVDTTEDGVTYGAMAAEPNEGPLRQYVVRMTPADWDRLAEIATEAATVMRQEGWMP